MAARWTRYIWDERRDISGPELLCALALARGVDNDGTCQAGFAELASDLRVSVRHVQLQIAKLEGKKVIIVRRGGGRGNRSQFQFLERDNTIKSVRVGGAVPGCFGNPETVPESVSIIMPEKDETPKPLYGSEILLEVSKLPDSDSDVWWNK